MCTYEDLKKSYHAANEICPQLPGPLSDAFLFRQRCLLWNLCSYILTKDAPPLDNEEEESENEE